MAERELIGILALVLLLAMIALRLPIGLAMIVTGIGGNFALSLAEPHLRFDAYLRQFKTLFFGNVASYELSVVPLFILMGALAARTGMARDLFRGIEALIGALRGGLAMAAVVACAAFGAVCGSSLATAATMGKVALPQLRRMRYAPELASGALAAGGTLGILIPPSVALILYALVVEASITALFRAALIPGLIAVLFFVLLIAIQVRRNPALAPEGAPMTGAERSAALRALLPVLMIFSSIILGLGMGLFTPTPAAGVGVCLILLHGVILRRLTRAGLSGALMETARTAGMITFILFGAEVLKGFFSRAGLPTALAQWAEHSALEPWTVLIAMLLILIVLGCFLESLTMILVVVPFLWPVLVQMNGGADVLAEQAAFGVDSEGLKLWFGILALVVVELGLITPPLGLNVLVIGGVSPDVPIARIYRGVLPFVAVELIRIALLLALPMLCLWLPELLARGG
ncbi:MAG: TRAP transporter large permease [Neomegalonema sp.]|nr:TRAP transporter large permease [Neomegalonema sp.]